MRNIFKWIGKRLQEPSTHAGMAAVGLAVDQVVTGGLTSTIVVPLATSLLSIFMQEKGQVKTATRTYAG